MRQFILSIFLLTVYNQTNAQQWSTTHANEWYQSQQWLVGCNFIPSTAINQLEMWQAETFDPKTIDRELSWAQGIGMNCLRVFLHDLAYQTDPKGLKNRMDTVLSLADKHGIKIAFVIFDDCWNEHPKVGLQPKPKPGIHNSGWVQSPGKDVVNDSTKWERLEKYVKDVLTTYAIDKRVLCWDLYNEPGNSNQGEKTLQLLTKVFKWAREVNPSQPLTSGVWSDNQAIRSFQIANSDIITFHNYEGPVQLTKQIDELQEYNRPVICTEWMARTRGSICETHLPIFKGKKVGCLNWGLVSGKTQTIYPWGSKSSEKTPKVWFHDLFHPDGTPYLEDEITTFRKYTFNLEVQTALKTSDFDSVIDGRKTSLYFLKNKNGLEAAITSYGGRVVSLIVPDRNGKMADIVQGFPNLHDYIKSKEPYFGALIGRYANRINKGRCKLNGTELHLEINSGGNCLHGGKTGFNAVVWDVKQTSPSKLELHYLSKDGEEGFPGNVDVVVVYELTDNNELKIDYKAVTDKPTFVNLTHHSFFNLQGEGNGNVNDHLLMINADKYTPMDKNFIPTGEIASVEGTPFDFRSAKAINKDMYADNEQLKFGIGYDCNFVLSRKSATDTSVILAARVEEPLSGRVMEVWTNEPAIQFYGGNVLTGKDIGKAGRPYYFRTAFCLETQHYPDSPNYPNFPSTVLEPGQVYYQICIYRFTTK